MGRHGMAALAVGLALVVLLPPPGAGQPVGGAPPETSKLPLTALLPAEVPGAEQRAGWQEIRGEAHGATDGVRYVLFVNPRYEGLYQITQFRLWSRVDGQFNEETEKLLWNPEPGNRKPLHLYSREGEAWQRIPPGSPAYDREIIHAINVYNLHRQSLGYGQF
jgi:hypothetical protein